MDQLNETGIAIALLCGFALVAWLLGFWAGMCRAGKWKAIAQKASSRADAYLERDNERCKKLKVRLSRDKQNRWRWRIDARPNGRTLANCSTSHDLHNQAYAEADLVVGYLGKTPVNDGPAK